MTQNWKGKKVLVVGLGRTGLALCRFLAEQGAELRATDTRSEDELKEAAGEMKALGVALDLGGHSDSWFTDSNLIVLSPGVPPTLTGLLKAKQTGVPVTGEMELAAALLPEGRMVAVTGTNGKSTTVSLIFKMLEAEGKSTVLCGNVGNAFLGAVDERKDTLSSVDRWVVEVSSYQMETADTFRPRVAALLNVTPDHTDRYDSMADYRKAKERIFARQQSGDTAVLNADEPESDVLAKTLKCEVLYFSLEDRDDCDAFVRGEDIWWKEGSENFPGKLLSLSETKLLGTHNLQNLMVAALCARAAGASKESIASAARAFEPLPHVMIEVAEIGGVKFYDNSKATNVDAAARSVGMFSDRRVVLILGGRDKGGDYTPLWDAAKSKVKRYILVGENRALLRGLLVGSSADVIECESMEEAVVRGASGLASGDVVLLAPAAASFDMYENYKERGRDFVRAVAKLKKGVGA